MNNEKSTLSKVTANDIPMKESLFLSPIEKYKIYGRFPWKMIIHIFLVIATTAEAVLTVADTTQYTRAQERLLYNFFISDSDKTATDFSRKTYLYSIAQVKDHLKRSVSNFYNLKSDSLETVEYIDDLKDLFIYMRFAYYDKKNIETKSKIPREFVYKINNSTFGPFDYPDEDVKSFLNSVTDFELNYTMRTYVPFFYGDHFECFHWNINQIYSFAHRAHFVTKLLISRSACTDRTNLTLWDYFVNRLMWIHIVVTILAVISLILTWKYVYKIAKLYWKMKRDSKEKRNEELKKGEYQEVEREKEVKINLGDEKTKKDLPIFNMWSALCLIGNIVQIFGASMSLFDSDNIMSSTEVLVGFGCMLSYMNVGRYLEYNRDYSTIFATIKRAMPNVLRYLFGVMPIFFGFIFFGLCLFWRSERFINTSSTMMTLFAMLNGDSVFDIFHDLSGVSFFIGQVYCYIFCIIFIVVVMNVFISIIEEAYVSTKMKNQNHWIYSYLKIDPKYVQIKDIEENQNGSNNVKHEKHHEKDNTSKIKSRNMLPENTNNSKKKVGLKGNLNSAKNDVEKVIEGHFTNIERSLNEVENISKEVSRSSDSTLKDEVRLTILDNIASLENQVKHLREMWFQQT